MSRGWWMRGRFISSRLRGNKRLNEMSNFDWTYSFANNSSTYVIKEVIRTTEWWENRGIRQDWYGVTDKSREDNKWLPITQLVEQKLDRHDGSLVGVVLRRSQLLRERKCKNWISGIYSWEASFSPTQKVLAWRSFSSFDIKSIQ